MQFARLSNGWCWNFHFHLSFHTAIHFIHLFSYSRIHAIISLHLKIKLSVLQLMRCRPYIHHHTYTNYCRCECVRIQIHMHSYVRVSVYLSFIVINLYVKRVYIKCNIILRKNKIINSYIEESHTHTLTQYLRKFF